MTDRPRILYVHSRKASFVAIDREILAERYEVERRGATQEKGAGERGRHQRRENLAEAAVDDAAHQPVEGVVESERGGGEGERQAGRGSRRERDSEAGQ